MLTKAMFFTPLRFSARPFVVMALFWLNNAAIALCQRYQTRVAVSLVEAFFGFAVAVNTVDVTRVGYRYFLADKRIDIYQLITNWKRVVHGIVFIGGGTHFFKHTRICCYHLLKPFS
jgi:hypothetical protein